MELPVVHVKFSCKDKDEFKQRFEASVLKKGILARASVSHEVGARVRLNLEVEDGTYAVDEEAVVLGHELVRGKQAMRLKLARVINSGAPPKLAPVEIEEWLEPIKTGEALAFDPKAPPQIAPVVPPKVNGHADSPMKVTTSAPLIEPLKELSKPDPSPPAAPAASAAPPVLAAKKKLPLVPIAAGVGVLVLAALAFALSRKTEKAPAPEPVKVVAPAPLTPKPTPPAPAPAPPPVAKKIEAPPPPPVAPPTPAAPATVQVSIGSTPSGAKVSVNGKPSGQTPLTLTWPKGDVLKLDFSQSGYKPAGKKLTPTGDTSVEVTLKKSGPKNDLKDVY